MRLEPAPGELRLDWLDRAIDTLGAAGLKVVLGTPTATPPRWMLDRHPDMLAWDRDGRPRKFGSRRHYDFSHAGYRDEAARITGILAERYGASPHVAAWQTDNEYGCHDTAHSYSPAATPASAPGCGEVRRDRGAERRLGQRLLVDGVPALRPDRPAEPDRDRGQPRPLARLPPLLLRPGRRASTACRPRSSARIPPRRSCTTTWAGSPSSTISPPAPTSTPRPGTATRSGFLEDRSDEDEAWKAAFQRQGDPDNQAFHHDLYRAVGRGRWWVMEQQPGPVNWAPYNPAPLPGMVRLWTWEAFAHGAEVRLLLPLAPGARSPRSRCTPAC